MMALSTMQMASTLSNLRKKKNGTVKNSTSKLSTGACKKRIKNKRRWKQQQQKRKKECRLCCQIKWRTLETRSGICSLDTKERIRSKHNLLRACQENLKTNLSRRCKLGTLRSGKPKEGRTGTMLSSTTMTMTTNTRWLWRSKTLDCCSTATSKTKGLSTWRTKSETTSESLSI